MLQFASPLCELLYGSQLQLTYACLYTELSIIIFTQKRENYTYREIAENSLSLRIPKHCVPLNPR